MSIKKCVNGSFVNDVYREYGTDTDTITTLPKTIIGDGQNISAYTIKGNMVQSGTPTPSNPIYPSECGDKTANLFDKDRTQGIIANAYVNQSGQQVSSQNYYLSYPIAVSEGETYTWSFNSDAGAQHTAPTVGFYDSNDTLIGGATHDSGVYHFTFTVPSTTTYIRASVYIGTAIANKTPMLLSGTTTIADTVLMPYIPYGYKIPISLSNTPIYLSEPIRKISTYVDECVSTGTASRPIKKLVLTGQKSGWEVFLVGSGRYFRYMISSTVTAIANIGICSHYVQSNIGTATINTDVFTINAPSSGGNGVVISPSDTTISTVTDFKQYLADQYSAGTPVTIWYVLATAETESFTAPSIPTSGSQQSFDVDTTLAPSEVSLTYHGWHEHSDTKYTTP